MSLTITEALAEIKTISKRLEKKRQYVMSYLSRPDGIKDPLAKDGGSATVIAQERQAIADLENRIVELRRGIQLANQNTELTVEGVTRSISDWLTWRRDVSQGTTHFLNQLSQSVITVREQARRQGLNVVAANAQPERPSDIVVNVNESELAQQREKLATILGVLDGQLSLKNATTQIAG